MGRVQGWQPEAGRYDVIWIQWAIGHLTDEDFVRFFADCEKGLKPDGIVVCGPRGKPDTVRSRVRARVRVRFLTLTSPLPN